MFAVPTSPLVLNFTPSFVAEITTVSPMLLRSLQMRAYSALGMRMVAEYSVSGMPRCSLSMSISLRLKSATATAAAAVSSVDVVGYM
jgi:hypothetical protein